MFSYVTEVQKKWSTLRSYFLHRRSIGKNKKSGSGAQVSTPLAHFENMKCLCNALESKHSISTIAHLEPLLESISVSCSCLIFIKLYCETVSLEFSFNLLALFIAMLYNILCFCQMHTESTLSDPDSESIKPLEFIKIVNDHD